jgi:2-phospho-L-lactate guanylyltransferase (CobY/MobA/RfbA family)
MNVIEWEAMKNINVITVDPATLVDIQTVDVNVDLPPNERMKDYIMQIKNPYCYKCGETIIKANFPFLGQKLINIIINILNDDMLLNK